MVERHALGHAAVALAIETLRAARRRRGRGARPRRLPVGAGRRDAARAARRSPPRRCCSATTLDRRVPGRCSPGGDAGRGHALDEIARRLRRTAAGGLHASRRGDRVLVARARRRAASPRAARAACRWGIAEEEACTLDGLADGAAPGRARAARRPRAARRGHGRRRGHARPVPAARRARAGRGRLPDGAGACSRRSSATRRDVARPPAHARGYLRGERQHDGGRAAAVPQPPLADVPAAQGRGADRAATSTSHEDRFVLELSLRLRRMAQPQG